VKIGDNTMDAPDAWDHEATPGAIDKGFWFERKIPAGEKGFHDVTVDNGDGQIDTIPKGYYYVECPGIAVDSVADETDGVFASGDTITVRGCGLTTDVQARLRRAVGSPGGPPPKRSPKEADPDQAGGGAPLPSIPLTPICGAGVATFAAPNLRSGDYLVEFVDSTGALLFPSSCDTADTGAGCVQFPVTYGSP
jgi:hypothetical protein